MSWSFPVGRLLGSELRVHATFFLLLGFVAITAWSDGGAQAAWQSTSFVLALFACVVAHEYGHALMARRFGIATPDITLLPMGGMARMTRIPERPLQEIAVALAGPAVNVVIWAGLALFGAATPSNPLAASGFLEQLAAVNLFLAGFNLLPAFPMDGGRVLRALLALRMNRVQATRIAAAAGQIAAFGFGFWGLSSGNLILVLIAVFIFLAAQAEASEVATRDVARGLRVRDATITQFERLAPQDTLDTAAQALLRVTQHEFPICDPEGRFLGFLTREALFRALAEDQRMRPVGDIMDTDIPALPPDAPLGAALDALAQAPALAVVTSQGGLLGYVTRDNLGELMVLRRKS